jgi:hypothetical protein
MRLANKRKPADMSVAHRLASKIGLLMNGLSAD